MVEESTLKEHNRRPTESTSAELRLVTRRDLPAAPPFLQRAPHPPSKAQNNKHVEARAALQNHPSRPSSAVNAFSSAGSPETPGTPLRPPLTTRFQQPPRTTALCSPCSEAPSRTPHATASLLYPNRSPRVPRPLGHDGGRGGCAVAVGWAGLTGGGLLRGWRRGCGGLFGGVGA